jgi:transposase InsO family protein
MDLTPPVGAVRVPQKRSRPRPRLKELVTDQAYHSQEFQRFLRRSGINPPFLSRGTAKKNNAKNLALFSVDVQLSQNRCPDTNVRSNIHFV